MFQYEYEKRPPSAGSCDSRATATTDWSRRAYPPPPPARTRPLPRERDSAVPLKVWVVASASCFAVCGALVLATVFITRWGSQPGPAPAQVHEPELIYSHPHPAYIPPKPLQTTTESDPISTSNEVDNDIDIPILEKLSIFRNVVATRNKVKKTEDLVSKPQIHPVHDDNIEHLERRIEKKDQAKLPSHIELAGIEVPDAKRPIPDFKPTLPDVFVREEIKLPNGYFVGLRKNDDYEEYYNDDNLYDDYMQSNTMTNYLIEKVQELHDWITTDPDLEGVKNTTKIANNSTEFSQVLKALNQSLVQGNVSIIMSKLKDIYFGDSVNANHSRKMILSNSTDLLSFGILTLDIMLLHNIQLMAWENQEAARSKMLRDPDVFAFNALFMEPSKVEAKQSEVYHHDSSPPAFSKRQNLRQDVDDFDIGKSLLENFLEIGMSTARAAIHLGRAYKNTKAVLNQLSNRETNQIQAQLSRNLEGNSHALNHLQASFNSNGTYTDLDCMWMLYCRNLVATSKLNAPYGTMARINGMALRMLAGELAPDKALETMVSEALGGWTQLKCDDLFPRCSQVNAASVVLDTILQPMKKAQANKL